MDGFVSMKMKRKDLEEVYDEFSEFSLSSPAKKIRRLDAELPPIMEEEEPAAPLFFEQQQFQEEHMNITTTQQIGDVMTEAVPALDSNEERALVLYKPVNTPFAMSTNSSNVSFRVNPDLIPGLRMYWTGNSNLVKVEEADMDDKAEMDSNNYMAVVPWVSSQASVNRQVMEEIGVKSGPLEEPMEAEAEEGASMEVEGEEREQAGDSSSGGMGGEGLQQQQQQWQRQHCMIPQLPPNTSTPIMWSW